MSKQAGQYFNIWTKEELDDIVEVMKNNASLTIMQNECRGIDENHVEYYWFMEVVYKKLQQLFGKEIQPIFGMYLNETNPWGVHTDAYHCAKFPNREPALSILIPLSLDNSVDNLDKGFTIVFNEYAYDNKHMLEMPNLSKEPNSAVNIHDEHLSHNSIESLSKLTVQGIYPWIFGSVIYWDSVLFHDSNNFLRYGLKSKQALVIHTYLPKKDVDD